MQLAAAALRLLGEDANLGHEIVMNRALYLQSGIDVDVARICAQIVEFGLGDEALRGLSFRQRDPHGSPQPTARLLGIE